MNKVPVYYDGSRGAISVSLRNRTSSLSFDGPGIRSISEGDAKDLYSPTLGGGAFCLARPLADLAALLNFKLETLTQLGAAGEIVVLDYQAPGSDEPVPYVAMTPTTKERLNKLTAELVAAVPPRKAPAKKEPTK